MCSRQNKKSAHLCLSGAGAGLGAGPAGELRCTLPKQLEKLSLYGRSTGAAR